MNAENERRCTGCGEAVGLAAKFCENCGQRLDAIEVAARALHPAPKPPEQDDDFDSGRYLAEFDSRDSARLSHEYFEAHVELLKGHRKRLKTIARSLDEKEHVLNELSRAGIGRTRTREIQTILETVEALGDEWEDLQLAYNRESEALDEDFQDRFAEMELDVELPEDLQETMGRELEVMTRSFDRVGERIATLGSLGNAMIAGAEGRYFGEAAAGRGLARVLVGALLGWLGTAIWLRLGPELDLLSAGLIASPALILPVLVASVRP